MRNRYIPNPRLRGPFFRWRPSSICSKSGGAFGIKTEWIVSAIQRALELFERYPLAVKIVSHRAPNLQLKTLF
jgi:hypothetical protein